MKITRKILISIVISVALILSNIFLFGHVTGTSYAQISPLEVIKCSVIVPEEFYVSYQGNNQKDFPNGFKPAVGSGITVKSVNSDGSIELYFITDRGPNTDGPKYKDVSNEYKSIIFPAPKFQPQIALGILKNGKVEVVETIALKNKEGEPVTGLPITPGLIGATNEIALTENLQIIGYRNDGLDPEGIALDHEGNFWICDEYGPFVAKFDKKGKLLKKYAPGSGLPEVLKYRIPNRGFEGITVAPNGKIYVAVQSVLDIEGKTAATAQFTRIVELDPLTGKTRMYAYPIDRENYKSPKDAKIGDIFAISDNKLLLIEQGKDKEKRMHNIIYLVELQGATDISSLKIDGKEPEFVADQNKLSVIKFVSKTMIIDLRAHGWKAEKAEGIAMLPDGKTIAVVSDNDFGIAIDVQDSENQDTEILDYTLHPDGSLKYNNKTAKPIFRIVPNPDAVESDTQFWLIKLPETLK